VQGERREGVLRRSEDHVGAKSVPEFAPGTITGLERVYRLIQSVDTAFLDEVMGTGGVADVDDFSSALWTAWKRLRDEGVPPVRETPCSPTMCY
jgi:hypothetical protein